MAMLGFVKRLLGGKKREQRGFTDLMSGRLISDWLLSGEDPNARLRGNILRLRRMSRDMSETNHYAISWLNLRVANVVGPDGFRLQSQVTNRDGSPDPFARRLIEQRWCDWKCAENCTVGQAVHGNDEERTQERTLATDGELFIWIYPGFENAHRFATRTFEADHIDHEYNLATMPDSANHVIMGREIDPSGRCVAFWVDGEHPGGMFAVSHGEKRTRVPALSEYLKPTMSGPPSRVGYILHQFDARRPNQQRGIPELAAVTAPLRHLERTEEAHHIAARLSSCAVFQQIDSNADGWEGDDGAGSGTTGGDRLDVAPGFIAQNGMGRKWEVLQPAFPNTSLPDHGKYTLKGAGQALGVSYPTFSGDLEGTSYSSGRTGALVERDLWRVKQDQAINARVRPIFLAWLRTQLFFGLLDPLKSEGEMFYRACHIQGRRWDWVDPLKDSMGKQNDLAMGITTPQRVLIERGFDPEEVLAEWAEWRRMEAEAGLPPTNYSKSPAPPMKDEDEDGEKPPALSGEDPGAETDAEK